MVETELGKASQNLSSVRLLFRWRRYLPGGRSSEWITKQQWIATVRSQLHILTDLSERLMHEIKTTQSIMLLRSQAQPCSLLKRGLSVS